MTRRLDDLAHNPGQPFESPAAKLEMIRRATPLQPRPHPRGDPVPLAAPASLA